MSQDKVDPTTGMNPFAFTDLQEENYATKKEHESPLAPSVYDTRPNAELEEFIPGLLGEDNAKAIKYKADSMGVIPLTALRQVLGYAFIENTVQIVKVDGKGVPLPVDAADKRTGNDNNPKWQTNIQIRALIRQSNYGLLTATATQLGMSNLAAFKAAVASAFATEATIEKIKDSEQAMAALEKRF